MANRSIVPIAAGPLELARPDSVGRCHTVERHVAADYSRMGDWRINPAFSDQVRQMRFSGTPTRPGVCPFAKTMNKTSSKGMLNQEDRPLAPETMGILL
jgi:hypothetical protein